MSSIPAESKHSTHARIGLLLLTVGLVFNSGYALRVTEQGSRLTIPLLLVSLFIVGFLFKRTNPSRTLFVCYVLLVTAMGLSIVANFSYSAVKNTAVPFGIVTLAYLTVTRIPFDRFAEAYIRLIRFLAVVAICVYLVVNVLQVHLDLPVIYNYSGLALQNGVLFFLFRYPVGASPALGPFWEPGLFAGFLAIAAILEVSFVHRSASKSNLAIFIVGMLSTHTSAGVALSALLLLLYTTRKLRRLGLLTAALGVVVIMVLAVSPYSVARIPRDSGLPALDELLDPSSASVVPRVNIVLVNLMVFKESPIFGVGFGGVGVRYAGYGGAYLTAVSQTSTSAYMLAAVGLLGALYTVFWVVGILRLKDLSLAERVLVLAVFLLIVNKEPHSTIVGTYCFLFYFIQAMGPFRLSSARREFSPQVGDGATQGVLDSE